MNYFLLNAFFLSAALIVFLISLSPAVGRRTPVRRSALMATLGVTLLVLLVITVICDNLIIGFGIVDYHQEFLSGVFLGVVPVEDLSYSLAAVLLLPAVWRLLPAKRGRP